MADFVSARSAFQTRKVFPEQEKSLQAGRDKFAPFGYTVGKHADLSLFRRHTLMMTPTRTRLFGAKAWLPFAGALLAIGLAGCGNTLSGAKQDASTDTQKVSTAADQAAAKTDAAARNAAAKTDAAARNAAAKTDAAAHKVGAAVVAAPEAAAAATVITPEVKTAIIRDPVLNDPRNLINVASKDNVTHLTGHVVNADMKRRATEDAQAVLSKRHGNYTVSNELQVPVVGA